MGKKKAAGKKKKAGEIMRGQQESSVKNLQEQALRAEYMKKISKKRKEVQIKEGQLAATTAQRKVDKAEYEEALGELLQMIDDYEKPVPLFDSMADEADALYADMD